MFILLFYTTDLMLSSLWGSDAGIVLEVTISSRALRENTVEWNEADREIFLALVKVTGGERLQSCFLYVILRNAQSIYDRLLRQLAMVLDQIECPSKPY